MMSQPPIRPPVAARSTALRGPAAGRVLRGFVARAATVLALVLGAAAAACAQDAKIEAVVRTRDLALLAERWQPGALDAETRARLLAAIDRGDSRSLARELEKHLRAGDKGYALLSDFFRALDADFQRTHALFGNDRLIFALSQLAARHEAETAELAHYFLVVSRADRKSQLRLKLYSYLPVLLAFHRGRFPDLDAELRRDILVELERPDMNHPVVFAAIEALELRPPHGLIEKLLRSATTLEQYSAIIGHLERRDDFVSAGILDNFAGERLRSGSRKAEMHLALQSLVRMKTADARRAIERYLASSDTKILSHATAACFSFERTGADAEAAAPIAVSFLNSPLIPLPEKEGFLSTLASRNPAVFAALRERAAQIEVESLRNRILEKDAAAK